MTLFSCNTLFVFRLIHSQLPSSFLSVAFNKQYAVHKSTTKVTNGKVTSKTVRTTNMADKKEGTSTVEDSHPRSASPSRPQFGNRFLTDPKKVFQHNAWDNVVWDEEQEQEARSKVASNTKNMVPEDQKEKYDEEADKFWDEFYMQHQNRFFKDRQWLFTEFPELNGGASSNSACSDGNNKETNESLEMKSCPPGQGGLKDISDGITSESDINYFPGKTSKLRYFEVGCGVGNTVFPVLQTNNDPGLFIYCCDLSETAIQLVKEHADYSPDRCHAFVCDIADDSCQLPVPHGSLDIVILIFVLSALHPDKMQNVINKLSQLLRPGGVILFRDYGRYDLAQLRFKNGQCLSDNFYVRGDGTRVYFFTQEELQEMFKQAGLVEEQNLVDRRLQVNRGRQLKMYRVWVQCKYKKPFLTDS